jgi:hypothetical protein
MARVVWFLTSFAVEQYRRPVPSERGQMSSGVCFCTVELRDLMRLGDPVVRVQLGQESLLYLSLAVQPVWPVEIHNSATFLYLPFSLFSLCGLICHKFSPLCLMLMNITIFMLYATSPFRFGFHGAIARVRPSILPMV